VFVQQFMDKHVFNKFERGFNTISLTFNIYKKSLEFCCKNRLQRSMDHF